MKTIDEIRTKQTNQAVQAASDEALLTLIAIKITNDQYAGSKKLWALIEKKARKALMPVMGIQAKALNTVLDEVEPCFRKDYWNN